MTERQEVAAARMRAKTKAEYIREGTVGWKKRRDTWERRERAIVAAAVIEQKRREEDRKLLLQAEARFDAMHRTSRPHVPETDSPDREEALMGNAIEEGAARRRQAQQLRRDQLQKAYNERKSLETLPIEQLGRIHQNVEHATYEQLIAAGWGDHERSKIPPDWQTRRPASRMPPASAVKLNGNHPKATFPPDTGRKLA